MVLRFSPCSLTATLSQQPRSSCFFPNKIVLSENGDYLMKNNIMRPRISPSVFGSNAGGLRVFVASDLHTDYVENMKWVKCLSTFRYREDVLLVPGDVAETYDNFVTTMSLLKERFLHVFFVPGNHDLWCRREEDKYVNSIEKLHKILYVCKSLGVETKPTIIDGLGIIPLFSWYHESFDREKDITGISIPPLEMACKDFRACKWPAQLSSGDTSLAVHFDSLNEKNCDVVEEIQMACDQVISFSHFVPRQELCPEKRMLFYPYLPKIIGSDSLEDRVRSIHKTKGKYGSSACHVFGHTHFCWDAVIDGIRPLPDTLKTQTYPKCNKNHLGKTPQSVSLACDKPIRTLSCYLAPRTLNVGMLVYLKSPNALRIAYVQAPLAYPRERKRRMNGGEDWLPFCIYADRQFSKRISPCYWSDYYSANPRTPQNTELAPWVARFYSRT